MPLTQTVIKEWHRCFETTPTNVSAALRFAISKDPQLLRALTRINTGGLSPWRLGQWLSRHENEPALINDTPYAFGRHGKAWALYPAENLREFVPSEPGESPAREHWYDALDDIFGVMRGKVTLGDVAKVLGLPIHRRDRVDDRLLADVMRELGFRHKPAKVYGKLGWCYVRAGADDRHYPRQIFVVQDPLTGRCTATYGEAEDSLGNR